MSFCIVHFLNFIVIKLEYSHELSDLDNKISKKHMDILWIPITYGYYLCDAKNYIITKIITNIICYLQGRTSSQINIILSFCILTNNINY